MLSLAYPLVEEVRIEEVAYKLNMSFDNIIRFYDLMNDEEISGAIQIEVGLEMLIGENLDIPIEKKNEILTALYQQIFPEGKPEEPELDIMGNPMPSNSKKEKSLYCLNQDAPYIYASFMQCYGIDLIEHRGVLRWEKFQALLTGLDESTIFKQIVGIRSAELPTGKGSAKERKRLIELKRSYALKGQEIEEDDEDE